jgi:DNA replication protein DnaC
VNNIKKFDPCDKGCCSSRQPGYRIKRTHHGDRFFEECEIHKEYRIEQDMLRSFRAAGLRPDLFDYDLKRDYKGTQSKDNVNRILKYIENWSSNEELQRCLLYFTGPNGTQKTMIAHYVGMQLIRQGHSVLVRLMNDVVKDLCNSQYDENAKMRIDDIMNVDLLILDEAFDRDKITIYKERNQIPFIDSFIRDRIDKKGLILISNVKTSEIDDIFGNSLKDLLQRKTSLYDSELEFTDNWQSIDSRCSSRKLF